MRLNFSIKHYIATALSLLAVLLSISVYAYAANDAVPAQEGQREQPQKVRINTPSGVFAVGGVDYFYHENGTTLRDYVLVPNQWIGPQPMRFRGFWVGDVQYFDADGVRVYPNPENFYRPGGYTLTARWSAIVEPPEEQEILFVIYLATNRHDGFEDGAAFRLSTTSMTTRLTAQNLVGLDRMDNTGYTNDLDRLNWDGYNRIAWTRARQNTPFRGTAEQASEHATRYMGGRLAVGMQIGDIFNCLIWRSNVIVEGNQVILFAFAFWHEEY